ncbi:nucleotidyltransferase family protein [Palleronia abyssalis]|uniref:Uncharacterized protein n=1 Tax=Palleronia abyssalis TaxID=1501240 RepID=A0A2R8BZJ0_9RHOB|nr:nucleotidyltransferase family protein [Palleronia abyssalis]SPJ25539.1 hypothetical protein PAA8504_03390 [Palleronia abyssalis]
MTFAPFQYAKVAGESCDGEVAYTLFATRSPTGKPQAPPSPGSIDPERLFELARLNKVIPILPTHPQDLPEGCGELASRIALVRLRTLALNRRGLLEGMRVSGLLRDAGIEHCHLKGPPQQIALYGTYARKPSADIDILVRPKDRKDAITLLRKAGFEKTERNLSFWWTHFLEEIHLTRPDHEAVLDLHHGLGQAGLPRPLTPDRFIDRRVEIEAEGTIVETPCAVDCCLLGAITIAKAFRAHEPMLAAVLDLRAALHALDPCQLRALPDTARKAGLEKTLALSLRILDAVHAGSLPRPIAPPRTPFSGLGVEDLRRMAITPWVPGLPWPRQRIILFELCGEDYLGFGRESLRLILSNLFRSILTMAPARKRKTR